MTSSSSQTFPLKLVSPPPVMKSPSSEASPLELVTFCFIRKQYEKKYKQNVPMALKYLTFKFSNMIIGCNMLTIAEDLELSKLLLKKLPSFKVSEFLYRASDHNFSSREFHDVCDGIKGTMSIIMETHGHIFGGYTTRSWNRYSRYKSDQHVFLFLIRSKKAIKNKCPLLLELEKSKRNRSAIYCKGDLGPTFGDFEIKIVDRGNVKWNESKAMYLGEDEVSLTGTMGVGHDRRSFFLISNYEVFQIKS